ncbi:MAG: hypothetical protein JWR54_3053, partial [Mucilaginibacter sp.]|nr:hypothetical protein [Mucilaginibacter sp.]
MIKNNRNNSWWHHENWQPDMLLR